MSKINTQPTAPAHDARDARPAQEMAAELQQLIERGGVRWRRLILIEAACLTVASLIGYVLLVFLLDNVIHLPTWGLLLANIAFLACLVVLGRRLVLKWRRTRFTADQVALAIEQRTPGGVENRLINALQLSREATNGAQAMADAVIGENYQFLKQVQLQQSAESKPVIAWGVAALVLLAIGVGFWQLSAERFTASAGRLFLPFAGIEPIYRTRLTVTPGNVTIGSGADVNISVRIEGVIPDNVQLMVSEGDRQSTHRLAVDPANATASYTLPTVRSNLTYWLRAGDYRSPQFQVIVPMALELRTLEAKVTYPAYTQRGEQTIESRTGELEVLAGTTAQLSFTLNQPVESAWLVVTKQNEGQPTTAAAASTEDGRRVELTKNRSEVFGTPYTFTETVNYVLHARRAGGDEVQTNVGRLRAAVDAPPQVQLTGIESDREVMLDDVLKLTVRAEDDYGVAQAGVFWRPVPKPSAEGEAKTEPAEWQAFRTWDIPSGDKEAQRFRSEASLLLSTQPVAEGDRLELAARARDGDPAKAGQWTTGAIYTMTASSPGAALQLIYERILQSERSFDDLIDQHTDLDRQANRWAAKFEPDSGVRWDDKASIDELAKGMKTMAEAQSKVRLSAGAAARSLPPEAGRTFPQALGMLADTEMVRHIRILERVSEAATPQDKRTTLADARLTVQRTIRSLKEMRDRYIAFREDWELNHMISFTEMLARRQERLAESSTSYAKLTGESLGAPQRTSISRRQTVLMELSSLAQTAFEGLAKREEEVGKILAKSFDQAAKAFTASGVKNDMKQASALLSQGDWANAIPLQQAAGTKLVAILNDLRAAQTEVARQALAALEELAKSDVEAQKALEELRAGKNQKVAMEENLTIEDTLRMMEVTKKLREKKEQEALAKANKKETISFENALGKMQHVARETVDTKTHTLSGEAMPDSKAKIDETPGEGNAGQTVIQENLEDVIGDLIEGSDELVKDFSSYQAVASWAVADTGTDVGKITSDPMSSTGATSTTGNQSPPTEDVGGAARTGRLGARSHGMAVGDDFVDRFGRAAQEGQENIAEQGGPKMRERASADKQSDEATGTGGRTVDSKQTHFSTKNAGKWNDANADKMEAPQEVVKIVERHGAPLHADIAAKMRDTEKRQEQVIERIKAVKKELNQLFLPTDHLDDIMAKMQDNLDRLREAPDADLFRQQVELLNKLQSSVVVFQRPSSDFVQSLPRQQRVKGQILDEKAAIAFPGYEEAVERYYRRLSNLEEPK